MKPVVMSLGGSIVAPGKIDYKFVKEFKKVISKINRKFVIIVGGGQTARTYIEPLAKEKASYREQSLIGIRVTRLNAWFLTNFFGKIASQKIPKDMKEVKSLLRKNKVVFAGGLRYVPDNTSDGTAASLASYFKTDLVNMTNVKGLYDKNPKKYKDAKFIPSISLNEFYKMANKIKYKPGQHFVLDQHASDIIKKNKVKTVILGQSLKNFENYLKNKKFIGTIIK